MRQDLLPYGRQTVDAQDVKAVVDVLRSDWLTTGPTVGAFEERFAELAGTAFAVSVSNGTAALHAAMYALDVTEGDEVIVPCMTFAASANAVVFQGGTPVFADVRPDTLLIDSDDVAAKISDRTRAVVAVDYTGHPCDYDRLRAVTNGLDLPLVSDACHAVGGSYKSRPVGSLGDLSAFSFHPVKHLTTGEGGMITTDDAELAARMRRFRNHGIRTDHRERAEKGSWHYEMIDLGYNYRLTDIQAALGISQLEKLPAFVARRREIAARYDRAFEGVAEVEPLSVSQDVNHAYHLYVIQLRLDLLTVDRSVIFDALRAEGIGVNVHYIPVHLHPYYRDHFGTRSGDCPVAEAAYERLLTLPLFPSMSDEDTDSVIQAVEKVVASYRR